jgi:hypothetical protein
MRTVDDETRKEVGVCCLVPLWPRDASPAGTQVRDARLEALEADNYVEDTGEGPDDDAYVDSEVGEAAQVMTVLRLCSLTPLRLGQEEGRPAPKKAARSRPTGNSGGTSVS